MTTTTGLLWYYNNKEKSIKRSTAWRKNNPERVKELKRQEYLRNKLKYKERVNNYYHSVAKFRLKDLYDNDPEYRKTVWERNQKKLEKKRETLLQMRKELGGKCTKCGYDAEIRILQFHHHNGDKVDNVTNLQSLKKIQEEARKCVLLCPNCHALEHLC